MNKIFTAFNILLALFTGFSLCNAQQITGAWKGKINNQKVELKIIQKGDSLTGTSYYYGLTGSHKRYSIKGYFDPYSNSAVWWNDELITPGGTGALSDGLLSVADFNCPGGTRMFLNGKSSRKKEPRSSTGDISLTKIAIPFFHDEWDFVLDNYLTGGNDPGLIDSIGRIARGGVTAAVKPMINPHVVVEPSGVKPPQKSEVAPARAIAQIAKPVLPPTIDELFTTRKKVFTKEIPVEGDSIQLHFYDNAEVDGDSITLYLNDKMIFTHVRLTASPYTITLPVKELAETSELVMVAENLGTIPPNTAFMIAMVAGRPYEAYLESTEGSSSLIRFRKSK